MQGLAEFGAQESVGLTQGNGYGWWSFRAGLGRFGWLRRWYELVARRLRRGCGNAATGTVGGRRRFGRSMFFAALGPRGVSRRVVEDVVDGDVDGDLLQADVLS